MKRLFLLLLLLSAASPLRAAIAFEASNSYTDNVSTPANISHSFTCPTVSNGILIMGISAAEDITAVTVPKWDGVDLTQVTAGPLDAANSIRVYYVLNPHVGTLNATYTITGANQKITTGVSVYSGVHQTVPLGTPVEAHFTSGDTPITVNVTSATGEMVVDVVACANGIALTVGSGQTSDWNTACCAGSVTGASSHEPGAATVTMSWSRAAGALSWRTHAFPLKPAAATVGAYPYLIQAYRRRSQK